MQFVHVGFESQFSDSDFAVSVWGALPLVLRQNVASHNVYVT
jgi:hypothetical protein